MLALITFMSAHTATLTKLKIPGLNSTRRLIAQYE